MNGKKLSYESVCKCLYERTATNNGKHFMPKYCFGALSTTIFFLCMHSYIFCSYSRLFFEGDFYFQEMGFSDFQSVWVWKCALSGWLLTNLEILIEMVKLSFFMNFWINFHLLRSFWSQSCSELLRIAQFCTKLLSFSQNYSVLLKGAHICSEFLQYFVLCAPYLNLSFQISSLNSIHSIVYSVHNTVWVEQQSFNFTTDTSYLNTYIYERKKKSGRKTKENNFPMIISIHFFSSPSPLWVLFYFFVRA